MYCEHAEEYSSYAPTSYHARCMLAHEQYWLFSLPKNLWKPSKQCGKHPLSETRDQRFPECLAVFMTEILHGNYSLPGNVWGSGLLEIYEQKNLHSHLNRGIKQEQKRKSWLRIFFKGMCVAATAMHCIV